MIWPYKLAGCYSTERDARSSNLAGFFILGAAKEAVK
jgi:hypothetical protein